MKLNYKHQQQENNEIIFLYFVFPAHSKVLKYISMLNSALLSKVSVTQIKIHSPCVLAVNRYDRLSRLWNIDKLGGKVNSFARAYGESICVTNTLDNNAESSN